MDNLASLTEEALQLVDKAADLSSLDQVRVDFLGKKGQLTGLLKTLGKLSPDERPAAGAKINEAKEKVLGCLNAKKTHSNRPQLMRNWLKKKLMSRCLGEHPIWGACIRSPER